MAGFRQNYVTALDIGSSKIVCFIAKVNSRSSKISSEEDRLSSLQIIGIGEMESRGVKHGTIVDMQASEQVIRAVLDEAESKIKEPIDQVLINISAGNPKTHYFSTEYHPKCMMTEKVVHSIYEKAVNEFVKDQYIIHAIPTNYTVDGVSGVVNLSNMRADHVIADIMFITADLSPLRNNGLCIEKCHVELGGRVVTPYASGLGVLTHSERMAGAICIDIGAETTSIGVFYENNLIFADIIKLGSAFITKDIAQVLSTNFSAAELLKRTKGSANYWLSDERESIEVPIISEDTEYPTFETIPRSKLTDVIRPRVEEILELVKQRLQNAGISNTLGINIVFTGGGSQLTGITELAAAILGTKPRIGSVMRLSGLPENKHSPAYATCIGLLNYAVEKPHEIPPYMLFKRTTKKQKADFGKIFNWLKQNF
jgi:cell division protein FtsA